MIASAYLNALFPFKYSKKNYIESFNEIMVFTCALLQMIMAGYPMNNSIGSDTRGIKKN